ncbi:MAG: hypothetical protein ACYS9X_22200 [Planctomycetota bacterium]
MPRPWDPRNSTRSLTVSSEYRVALPDDLARAGVKATGRASRIIDDFARSFHDWYRLDWTNRHQWQYVTRKPVDYRWMGPKGGRLSFEIAPTEAGNVLGVVITTNEWRGGYNKRPREEYRARVVLERAGRQRVELPCADFKLAGNARNAAGGKRSLEDWDEITQLGFRPGKRVFTEDKSLGEWRGDPPALGDLKWVGGTYGPRPKIHLAADERKRLYESGDFGDQYRKAIDDSVQQEDRDAEGAR